MSRTSGLLLLALLGACQREATPNAAGERAFVLDCAGSATHTSGTTQCVRTDTRSGEVLRVDLTRLPFSNGPTGAAAGPAGRYQTACVAVNMAERSDFSCVRLNTESGELMLINLQKVGELPGK